MCNLAANASLNTLWSMVNNQQIIVLCPLMRINLPGNIKLLFNKLLIIASFNFVPTDMIFNKLHILKNTEILDRNLEQMGFNSVFFLRNMGSMLLGFILLALILVFLKLSSFCKGLTFVIWMRKIIK